MVIEISIAIIAFVLVLQSIFIVITLLKLQKVLNNTHEKMHSLDNVFQSFKETSKSINKTVQETGEQIAKQSLVYEDNNKEDKINDIIALVALSISLWKKYKKRS